MIGDIKILLTKLLPPSIDVGIMGRPRLLEKLFLPDKQLKVISFIAPAGYGKTVLMLQICNSVKKPVVWYQLDAYDNDLTVFLQYLVAGIRQYFPNFGKSLLSLINSPGAIKKQRQIITALINELTSQVEQGLIFALDDYHLITAPVVHFFLEEFLNCLPLNIQVFLAGRTTPPLSLSRYSMTGTAVTIDIQEIRFTREEIITYFSQSEKAPSQQIIEIIEKETEGWPVALRLLKNSFISTKVESSYPEINKIFDYLLNEVLKQQTESVQKFLVATSVLEVLTPEICNLLLERNDSQQTLVFLEKQQLFLTPLARKGAFRYHQLFREFLLNYLGPERTGLSYRAGKIAAQFGDIERAIEYFNTAGAFQEATQLIIENGKQALRHGRWQTVLRWLEGLPPEHINKEPWLTLYLAEVKIYQGKLIEAEHLLDNVKKTFEERQDWTGLTESLSQQARLLRSRGRYSESIELLDRALPRLLPEDFRKRFDFSLEKSFALVLAGKFGESEVVLTEALKIAEKENDGYLIANFSEALSNLYFLMGDYSRAMEMYQRAISTSSEPILTSYYMRDSVALIYRDWGDLNRAFEHATRSIAVKEKLGLVEVLPYAYYQLASIQVDRGDLIVAEDYYRQSIHLARESGGEQVFLIMSLAMLAKLLLTRNQFAEARSLAEEALTMAQSQSDYVIAFTKEMVAPVFLQTGNAKEAVQMLFEATAVLERIGAQYPLCIAYGILTTLCYGRGEVVNAREYARKCLELAARGNYRQIFLTTYDLFKPVLQAGLDDGLAVTFIQQILARLGSKALELISQLAVNSDPQIRRRVVIPLAEIGGVEARKTIRSLLNDPSPEVQELSQQVAGRLGIINLGSAIKPAIPLLRFDMLGSVKIFIHGAESTTINWTTLKARDLLIYLVHHHEMIDKDRILEDLWPDLSFDKSSHLFHTTLYYLRQILERTCRRRDLIVYRGGGYRLLAESFVTDREHFEELFSAAKTGELPPEITINYLEEAASLYRSDYLVDFDYPWLIPIREHLASLYQEILLRLGHYYLEKPDYNQAIKFLRLLLGRDPFAEDILRLLMKAYAGVGDIVAIKEVYQTFVSALEEELGISPSIETKDLFTRLSAGNN